MFERIAQRAKEINQNAVKFTQEMIRIPSLPGEEDKMAELYHSELVKLGYDEVFVDSWGNVVGIIYGNEPGPTVMFNGHLDQVEVGDLSDWKDYPPFNGDIVEGEAYDQKNTKIENVSLICGRGASDCKGGLAAQVYGGLIIKELRDQGEKIPGNYMVTAVVMEELGDQIGMIKLLDETFIDKGLSFDAAISCETTSLKLHLGHRGRAELKITVYGSTAHGSAPWLGINAVNKASKLIDRIDSINVNGVDDKELGRSSIALTNIQCTPGRTGVVPDRCFIYYDRRFNSNESVESCIKDIKDIIEDLRKEDQQFNATVELVQVKRKSYTGACDESISAKQSWKISKDLRFVKVAAEALSAVGQNVEYGYWGFGTDMAVIFINKRKPTIGYSPGQELYISRPNDRVRIDYIEKAIVGNASLFLHFSKESKETFIL